MSEVLPGKPCVQKGAIAVVVLASLYRGIHEVARAVVLSDIPTLVSTLAIHEFFLILVHLVFAHRID